MNKDKPITLSVEAAHESLRIDTFITLKLPEYSRSFIQKLISGNYVFINNRIVERAHSLVHQNDTIALHIPIPTVHTVTPQELASLGVKILYETKDFLIIDKPAGLIVHATDSHSGGPTVVDWFLSYYPDSINVGEPGRSGIVHRLDKNTSGIMIIARTQQAYKAFVQMFKERSIKKTYRAIVKGAPQKKGIIDFPLGRNPVHRHKMAVFRGNKKPLSQEKIRTAHTEYRVVNYFKKNTLVEVEPTTGRTHQIRVHFSAIGHPLLGDVIYGKSSDYIARHALHAQSIAFTYEDKPFSFFCDLPNDFVNAEQILRNE